jgi:hypothetical protein
MATARPATSIDRPHYQRAGAFALVGALLLAVHAVYAAATGDQLPLALQMAPFFLCAGVVSLAITIIAVRGRNLGIALGMIGAVLGLGAAFLEAVTDDPGPFFNASLILAFAGALIVGLSFPKPRTGYPKYAVHAALSGAGFLVLRGLIGIVDEGLHDVAYLVPALAWGWLGRVALSADPLPRQTITAPKARPAGQTKPRPGQARKSKSKKKR